MSKSTNSTDATKRFEYFVNARGEQFPVHGVSPLLVERLRSVVMDEWVAQHGLIPERPTYTIETAAGDKETHLHDEMTLEVPGDPEATDLNKKQWAEYQRVMSEIETLYSVRLMHVVCSAVDVEPGEEWLAETEALGIKLPTDKPALRRLYVETHVISCADDIAKLLAKVLRLSGIISETEEAAAEATFQGAVEGATLELARAKNGKVANI